MNLIDKYKLYKTDGMSEERFLNDLKKRGTENDFLNVVQWYTSKFGCTSSKLLALCYYSYVWGLVFLQKEIAPFQFEKTEAGPIEINVEKIFGNSDKIVSFGERPELDNETEKLLNLMWQHYGQYDGKYLLERAKKHYPYTHAEEILQAKDMYMFYLWVGKTEI